MSLDRRILATAAFALLLVSAGCTTLGGGGTDTEALSADASYEFDTGEDAYITVNRDNYTAVYNVSAKVTGDEGTIELWGTNALTLDEPIELSALQFRYPNGTRVRYADGEAVVVREDGTTEPTDALAVETADRRTVVDLPAGEGHLAFTAPKSGKELTVQTPVHGSYEVVLPPGRNASVPIFSRVRPANDERSVQDGRVHLRWENLEAPILNLRWYLDRDLWLFGGLAAIAGIVGLAGAAYYYRRIKRAARKRDEEGLDVEYDDDDRGPPPGMR